MKILAERNSYCTFFLHEQNISCIDVINFLSDNESDTEGFNEDDMRAIKDHNIGYYQSRNAETKENSTLNNFCINLNEKAKRGEIDALIGRELELQRTIEILLRRTKNNPLYVGDPGVGKTAMVEGLAAKIAKGDVPDLLKNTSIYMLDMGMFIIRNALSW